MFTRSLSFVSFASAVLFASLALGGCAVDADGNIAGPQNGESENVVVTQTETRAFPTQIQYVAPECRAVLVSTGPGAGIANTWGCASDNPYTGQKRYAGEMESGLTLLLDEAKPGTFRCTTGALGTTCSRTPDHMIEKLCNETRTYRCPCGVTTHQVDGYTVGACRNIPQ